jgi:hypothetical protein
MKMEQTECSETLVFKLQTPGNNPEESIRQETYCSVAVIKTDWPVTHPCHFIPGEIFPFIHVVWSWLDHIISMEGMKNNNFIHFK